MPLDQRTDHASRSTRCGRSPLEDVCAELDIGDELLTMVVLTLEGEVGGNLILTFDEVNGRQLAASLLGCAAGHGRPSGANWRNRR